MGSVVTQLRDDDAAAEQLRPERDAIAEMMASTARYHRAVPLRVEGGTLVVAVAGPLLPERITQLRHDVGRPIRVIESTPVAIDALLAQVYPAAAITASDGTTRHRLEKLLRDALERRAHDIHIESIKESASAPPVVKLGYGIDGAVSWHGYLQRDFVDAIDVIVSNDSGTPGDADRRAPRTVKLEYRIDGKVYHFRVSRLPTEHGVSLVFRSSNSARSYRDLSDLNLSDPILTRMRGALRRPQGIFLVVGPPGEGKTTTIRCCLAEVHRLRPHVIARTVEHPVEMPIPGISQMEVSDASGLDFGTIAENYVTANTKIVFFSEMRTSEAVHATIEMAKKGIYVFSSAHEFSALGTISALLSAGVSSYSVGCTLVGLLYQRLVRQLCTCAEPAVLDDDTRARIEALAERYPHAGLTEALAAARPRKPRGCKNCEAGYFGRKPAAELFLPNEDARDYIERGAPSRDIAATDPGFTPAIVEGVHMILRGETTVEAVEDKLAWT